MARQKEEININLERIYTKINSYDDLFSIFDSRQFSERSVSVDFLDECKRAVRDKENVGFELTISCPKEKRKINEEINIKKRLKEHFIMHFFEREKEIKKIKYQGIKWILFGICAVVLSVLIKTFDHDPLIISLVEAIMLIPGWFGIWEGLGKIFITAKEKSPEYQFYKKMLNCRINFRGY